MSDHPAGRAGARGPRPAGGSRPLPDLSRAAEPGPRPARGQHPLPGVPRPGPRGLVGQVPGVPRHRCADASRPARAFTRGPSTRECRKCHVEHQGQEYELVWWGKAGRESFDHGLTGHALEGRHSPPRLRRCHVPPVGPSASGGGTLTPDLPRPRDRLRLVPRRRAPRPARRPVLRRLPHAGGLEPGPGLRPRPDVLAAHREARRGGLREVPHDDPPRPARATPPPSGSSAAWRPTARAVTRTPTGGGWARAARPATPPRAGGARSRPGSTTIARPTRWRDATPPWPAIGATLPGRSAPRRARPLHRLPRGRPRRSARAPCRRGTLRELPRRRRLPPGPLRPRPSTRRPTTPSPGPTSRWRATAATGRGRRGRPQATVQLRVRVHALHRVPPRPPRAGGDPARRRRRVRELPPGGVLARRWPSTTGRPATR